MPHVRSAEKKNTAGLEHAPDFQKYALRIGEVLNHVVGYHRIETFIPERKHIPAIDQGLIQPMITPNAVIYVEPRQPRGPAGEKFTRPPSCTRTEFEHFMRTGVVQEPIGERHADYRSSSHKRLMPQLMTKVPALRRWGKRVMVAIHEDFFSWLPECPRLDHSNAELTWLVYRGQDTGDAYHLSLLETVSTTLEGAVQSLTAAVPPPREEFERQLQSALDAELRRGN